MSGPGILARVAVDSPLNVRLIQGWRLRPRRLAGRVPGAPGTGVARGRARGERSWPPPAAAARSAGTIA